jgi:neutral ceramidase
MRKTFKLVIEISLIFISSSIYSFGLTASVASIDITPPQEMKFALGGYGDRMSKPATGVHDRIWAKALVLKNGDKKYVIVTLDVLGLPPNLKLQLIKTLTEEGWNEDNVMLLPSHSHASFDMSALNDKNNLNSPQIGIFQPELLEHVISSLVKVIRKADKEFQAVSIGTNSITVEGMNRNRRGDPDVDKGLTVTRIDYETGNPMAVLVNWTAHPTFMSEKDMLVSGGWPGYLQRELEQWIGEGVTVMYYNGAEGDQSPISKGGSSSYEKAEIYGRALAIKTFNVFKELETKSEIEFDYDYVKVDLPEQKVHPSFMETGGDEYNLTPEALDAVLNVMSPETTSIGVVRFGDLMIIGVPGELTSRLGLHVKNKLIEKGIKYPTIGGLANEWISYILTDDQYNNGAGYESSVSFYGDTLGKIITEAMINSSVPLTLTN